LHNNYENETYFVYLSVFDKYDLDAEREDMTVHCFTRWHQKDNKRYPVWCDKPVDCLSRGLIPTQLLRPDPEAEHEIEAWIGEATGTATPNDDADALVRFKFAKSVSDKIRDLRAVVANYNLPYLSLPPTTEKDVALQVFINMNTNSKPLSTYDIIVAEVEGAMGQSLHDLADGLSAAHPEVGRYSELADLVLNTSALMQGYFPNQRGAWIMDKAKLVEDWPQMEKGLRRMAEFLLAEGIYDRERLPTNAVLAPIAALYAIEIPEHGDKLGQDELLLKRYLWHSFFTDRYENAAATHAFADFIGLRRVIRNECKENGSPYAIEDVPVFAENALAGADQLVGADWPKRMSIRGRGVLAVMLKLGGKDFSTGHDVTVDNICSRQYHHVFPDALLKEAGVESFLALNCALILDKTNVAIGRKEPLQYLRERYEWTTEEVVRERLQSHLIPVEELANGGYEGLSESDKAEKIRADFAAFIGARARLVEAALHMLIEGRQVSCGEVCKRVSANGG
jgi:hypothetical protein